MADTGSNFAGWSGEGCSGTDVCTVTANQARTVTATFDAVSVNHAPSAVDVSATVFQGGSVNLQLSGTDPDGDVLFFFPSTPGRGTMTSASAVSCNGQTPSTCTQTWTYTPISGYTGPDNFTFHVDDAHAISSPPATISITVQPPTADLQVTSFGHTPEPGYQGFSVGYTATVKNVGPSAAAGTSFTLGNAALTGLPTGTTFVSGSVTSSLGPVGSCTQSGSNPVICTLTSPSVPNDGATWTITVFLNMGTTTPTSITVAAEINSTTFDPDSSNNSKSEATTVNAPNGTSVSTDVPPSPNTQTVADAAIVNGTLVTTSSDNTAASMAVPGRGPGGFVRIAEVPCTVPFVCGATPVPRLLAPAAKTSPKPTLIINNTVVQFVPPTSSYYNYQHPFGYTLAYDKTSVVGLKHDSLKVYYVKDDSSVLVQASGCPLILKATTKFPCVVAIRFVKSSNALINGDLRVQLLATYNDPKAGTGGHP